MRFGLKEKILILAVGLSFIFNGFPNPNEASSIGECKLAPIGQPSKRALEIHKELIYLFLLLENELSALENKASQVLPLIVQCSIDKCKIEKDMCPFICKPEECEVKASCKPISPDFEETVCSQEVKDEIENIKKEIEPITESIKELLVKIGKLGSPIPITIGGINVVGELSELKQKLKKGKDILLNFDPQKEVLLNCNQAKRFKVVPSCFPEIINFLGITLPLSDTPDSQIDYFVCQK